MRTVAAALVLALTLLAGVPTEALRSLSLVQSQTGACLMGPTVTVHSDVPDVEDEEDQPMGIDGGRSHTTSNLAGEEGTSCCDGMLCQYPQGVCCPGSSHCCPHGYTCTADYPPSCEDASRDIANPLQKPRITKVLKMNVNAPAKPKPVAAKQDVAQDVKPPTKPAVVAPKPAAAKPAAPKPQVERDSRDLEASGSDYAVDVIHGKGPLGAVWPPMAAFSVDGTAELYVTSNQRDWTGGGLIRNGTTNIVNTRRDCWKQCEDLPECRAIRFVLTNGECWLDSEVATAPAPCDKVQGKRNCVSLVKKVQKRDLEYEWGTATLDERDWDSIDQQNWVPSAEETKDQGGRLLRNGLRNLVDSEPVCAQQCADMKYCRVAMYIRPTGECWLSSKVAVSPYGCASRDGLRDCISFVKKKTSAAKTGKASRIRATSKPTVTKVFVQDLSGPEKEINLQVQVPTK